MQEFNPDISQVTGRFALVAAKFNQPVVSQLISGVEAALTQHKVSSDDIDCFRVPGAFELPLAAQQIAQQGNYKAVIAIGAVIRGGTPHFEYISSACAHGLTNAGLSTDVPIIFGVLTTDTGDQAFERSDPERGNKGFEVGTAALEMAALGAELEQAKIQQAWQS